MQIVMKNCFLNPENKFGTDSSCRFWEKRNNRFRYRTHLFVKVLRLEDSEVTFRNVQISYDASGRGSGQIFV